MLNKSVAIFLAVILLVFASTACGGGGAQSSSSGPEPNVEPEFSEPSDGPFEQLAAELAFGRSAQLLERLNSYLTAHRDGTFEETQNHHPPYPAEFPPAAQLPTVESTYDITIAWRETVVIDATTESPGVVYVVVAIDDGHFYILEPALLEDENGDIIVGFANSGFIAQSIGEFFAESESEYNFFGREPV